jgi:DNA gyrase subunit A
MMTSRGKIQRVNVAEIRPMGRNTQGVRIMRVDDGDTLAAVVPVPPGELEDADEVLPAGGESPAGGEPVGGEPVGGGEAPGGE